MDVSCRWDVLLLTLWVQASFVPGELCNNGPFSRLSSKDVLLIDDQEDPKCFTRTAEDFTCFFETADNKTYDLLYNAQSLPRLSRCPMSVQTTEDGSFLNIYSFPQEHVFLYVGIDLEVVERNTSTILYSRKIFVEEHFLLDPPFKVSLHDNDQAGQLRVSWPPKSVPFCHNRMSRIRYSSKGLGERTITGGDIIDLLVPGEEVQVQVSIKCDSGYWSSWSQPVRHMVPQSADDVSLICFTPDLRNITCQWNGSECGEGTGLFYKTRLSHTSSWTEWAECLATRSVTDVCHFMGDRSREVLVRLSEPPAPLSKTFYAQSFTLNSSIKTPAPRHLRDSLRKNKLCVRWESPFPSLSPYLQYEVGYQTRRGDAWMTLFPEGPANETCLDVVADAQYSVKVRAKPKGPTYSGHWSDWSEALTGHTPADIGTMLVLCIPLLMVMATVICVVLFSMYHSKIKQYFWPPVPNLDKVLQGFLAEVSSQKWDLSVITKQCPEETMSSVVEILSQEDISALGKQPLESTQLLSPGEPFPSKEKLDWTSGTDNFPDYVTLNKDSTIICPKGNNYVYEQLVERGGSQPVVGDAPLRAQRCSCTVPSCLCTQYLNHSYLSPAVRGTCTAAAAGAPSNPYANLPCS